MKKKFFTRIGRNLLLILICLALNFYSMGHFSDGGCDGGLCALALIMYTLPMLGIWFLLLIAINLTISGKLAGLIVLIIPIIANTFFLFMDFGRGLDELYLQVYIIYAVGIMATVHYLSVKKRKQNLS